MWRNGLLMFGACSSAKVLSQVVHDDIPIVAEDSPAQHSNTTVIDIDNVRGAAIATRHLLELGHQRIGHLGGPAQRLAAVHRLEGYRQALDEAGRGYESGLALRCQPTIRSGYRAALQLLASEKPTALFCYNDLMAIGAMVACQHSGFGGGGDRRVAERSYRSGCGRRVDARGGAGGGCRGRQ